jgi:hypothetical protein
MATGNQTNITPPRVSLIDERTGAVSREWYRWFYSLFTTLGSGTGIIPVDSGGTGLGTIPTNGQLLIGNGTGYSLNTLGTGAGISVTNGLGTIVVANTGVLSNIAGAGISVSSATGNVAITNTGVLSFSAGTTGLTPAATTTGAITLAGTLAIANGGTNGTSTPTAGAVPYGTGTAYAFTAAGTSGQVLTSAGAGVPTWTTPTTGTVTSVGLAMPVQFTVTNSPVTSSGTLTAAFTTQSANVLFAGPTSGAGAVPTFRALTTADIPALPYGSGTVTSVGLSLPSIMAVTNSPVTTSGTLTGTLTTQAVNSIFAGPSSGAAATPTFRALTTADIPALAYGTGTVTSVSVVSANGLAGTVATATTTPAITLSTTITGLLKGNGTAISAAVANTDYVPLSTVITKTADYTITNTDTWIINNKTGSALTLTFPAASSWTGRYITVKNMQAQAVNSASSNIVPIDSTSAGTAILLGVVGNWATMVSDGTNWIIMQAASNNNLLLE